MPINVIIIAAVCLLVLFVLIYIFTGNLGKTSQNIGSCITKGGKCANKDGQCSGKSYEDYQIPLLVSGDCTSAKGVCCIKSK